MNYLVMLHDRFGPPCNIEVFRTKVDAKAYLATYIKARGGQVNKTGTAGSYFDVDLGARLAVKITWRAEW